MRAMAEAMRARSAPETVTAGPDGPLTTGSPGAAVGADVVSAVLAGVPAADRSASGPTAREVATAS